MKCQHGNEITVIIELYADSYESYTVSRYDDKGNWYDSDMAEQKFSDFDRLRIKGCPECRTVRFEEE